MWQAEAPKKYISASQHELLRFQTFYLKKHAAPGSAAHRVLTDYTDAGESLWINNYLRGIHMDELSEANKKELRRSARILNNLIRDAPPSPQDTVLFRAIDTQVPRRQIYKTGDEAEFLFNGLISTSVSYDAAASFVEDDQTCCMLIMYIPKGTKMLQVMDASVWSNEKEVLLPHHSRFHIDAIAYVNGIKTYFCRLVEQTVSQRLMSSQS